jgi:ABC-type uncharacterized transport system ATPase subunit
MPSDAGTIAGKSTTIKMLCGILTPTSGKVEVNGITPHRDRIANARKIGAVFGQRSQRGGSGTAPCAGTSRPVVSQ